MTTDDFKPTLRQFQRRRKPSRLTLMAAADKRVALAQGRLALLAPLDPDFPDALNEYRDAIEARSEAENRPC